MLEAIVLAGGPNEGLLQECSTAPKEALIPIAGRHMVEYVLRALEETEAVASIVVVGISREDLKYQSTKPVRWVPGGRDLLTSMEQGLHEARGERVLLVTGDIPLINPSIIESFLEQCGDGRADLYYPVVSREDSESRFPGVVRTYAIFREGHYTGGNIFLVNPAVVSRWRDKLGRGTELRKSPWKLCRLLGLGFLVKYLCRSLSLRELETKAMQMFSLDAKIVVTHHPEIGVDVDKPGDLRLVEAALSEMSH
ncbi:MAG TPA: NTP transferase domain-containing protein [Bacillota bacterium]|nr:NTP transferase domain-containing protein [Bacillota bacterium]